MTNYEIKFDSEYSDPSGIVKKYIFKNQTAIAETVAYSYQDRGVVCFSVQSGCPVGCSFCGTGKKFIRNLNAIEIEEQIEKGLSFIKNKKKIELMAMSMGEPMLNIIPLQHLAKKYLASGYYFYISTVGIKSSTAIHAILDLANYSKLFGLQISLHCGNEQKRKSILGNYPNLMSFREIMSFTDTYKLISGNNAYFNYICNGTETEEDAKLVADIVRDHHLTCSVLCNTGDFIKADTTPALNFLTLCQKQNILDISLFDPAGQDTIGGGCGQLLYTQEFLNNLKGI